MNINKCVCTRIKYYILSYFSYSLDFFNNLKLIEMLIVFRMIRRTGVSGTLLQSLYYRRWT